MLKCSEMAELVTPLLEGALPLHQRLAARWHLRLCEACRRYVAQMRQTIRFLGTPPPPAPEPETENKIMSLIEAARQGSPPRP